MAKAKRKTESLARLLLLRKDLKAKVDQLHTIRNSDVYRLKAKRVPVQEGLDDLTMEVPLLAASQVTAEYDFYAKKMREVDALIQQTNWSTQVECSSLVFAEYKAPELERGKDDKLA